eukprot:CAMPEP_0194330500 /NCGR_PEP_ID=MMETSP0171-20130528/52174_1 /TAXON_ID=218684 /ORGANISM="Corethron pennatum, Strain L29A3" /LENGTH=1191 /DNA_ID=CAMNT_0039091613 /DNA_START=218 /DNA_END=3793 /DNA_ORIENTATION=-
MWEPPQGWPHPVMLPPGELLEGWTEYLHPPSGQAYYFDEDGNTQWECPQPAEICKTEYAAPDQIFSGAEHCSSYEVQKVPSLCVPSITPSSNLASKYSDGYGTLVSSSELAQPCSYAGISNQQAGVISPNTAPVDGVAGVGKSFLTNLAKGHSKWLWGGLAEILHNGADAGAGTIEIQRFPEPDTNPDDDEFGLRIDDDGNGITYDEALQMMQIASDSNFNKSKEGKVGGYGVGFKVGAIAMAQTAIVLSISVKDESTGTTVVGVLSNEPYEERGEFPLGLCRPNTEVIALWTKNGRCYDPKGITDSHRDELYRKTQRLNSAIDRDWITTWAGRRQDKPGTTIILCGVRRLFRANELGEKCKIHNPPRIRIDFNQPGDMVLCEDDDLKKRSVPFRHHPTARRIIGHPAKMDSSFRTFCEIMFLMEGPTEDLRIILFGKLVERVDFRKRLKNKMPSRLRDGKKSVDCLLGQHTFEYDRNLYGAMLYCEGTLITAYARPHNLEFRRFRGTKDDEEHFSTLLVVNLYKKDGFEPTPEKLEFNFNEAKKEQFWEAVKGKIEEYADRQASYRDEKFPLRPLFLSCIKDLKTRLRDYAGEHSDEGPLRGVLCTPPREGPNDEQETYHEFIKTPISLSDVELKAKAVERTATTKYVGTTTEKINAFKKDLTKIFKNSIKWESEGRFIPDTQEDIDINDVRCEDLEASTTKPFVCPSSGKKGPFNIKDIFKALNIPPEFSQVTVDENKRGYRGLTSWDTEFNYGTSVLVPHRQSVKAVKFAKKLLKITEDQVDSFVLILKSQEKAKKKGTVDDQVQCSICHNWRKFPGAVIKYGESNFHCEMEARSCEEPDDHNSQTDVGLSRNDDHEFDEDNASGSKDHSDQSSDNIIPKDGDRKRSPLLSSDSKYPQQGKRQRLNTFEQNSTNSALGEKMAAVTQEYLPSESSALIGASNTCMPDPISSLSMDISCVKSSSSDLQGTQSGTVADFSSPKSQYPLYPLPSENRKLCLSKVLATEFGNHVIACAAGLDSNNKSIMLQSVSSMLETWKEIEITKKEISVIKELAPYKAQYSRIRSHGKSPGACDRFVDIMAKVHAGIKRGRVKLSDQEKNAVTVLERAPRVPHELASSTLHKDPKRVVSTGTRLGIRNVPESHDEWVPFAKSRPEDASRLNHALKEMRENDSSRTSQHKQSKKSKTNKTT